MPPRNTRTASFSRMLSRLPWTRWPRTRVMMLPKRSQLDSMSLLIHLSIEISLRRCLITTENCLDLKTSSKSLSRRLSKEVCPFHKCSHRRKRSSMRKPRRWLTNTAGSYSPISRSVIRTMATLTVSCSTNQKSYKIKKQTDTSTRQWWSSVPRYYRLLLISRISQNLRRRSIVFSDRMLSIFLRESNLRRPERRNTHNLKSQDPRRPLSS